MAASEPFRPVRHDGRAGNGRTHDEERSLGELFSELGEESRRLIRQEVELARTELTGKAKAVGRDGGLIAAGAVLGYVGMLFVLAAAAIGLGHLIGFGWACLVVGVAVGGAGAFIALGAKKDLQKASLGPERTQHNVKETTQWIRHHAR